MVNLGKFIGIPHYYGRHGFDGADCAGLCRLFYEKHGYKETLDDGLPIGTAEDYKKTPLRMLRYLLKNLDRVDEPQYGDIIVTKMFGELHVGIYTEYNRVIAMEIPVVIGKTRSTMYREEFWKPHHIATFRRRS